MLLDNADGLYTGSSVISRGVIIGKVEELSLSDKWVVVKLTIKDKYKLSKESDFKVILDNVLQRKSSIDVTFSSSKDTYANNDTVMVHNKKGIERNVIPVELDSSSRAEMLKVFKQLDTLLNSKSKAKG
ncbi:MlaD family protein [uncultured Dysgonomonas sp.]|uniref:MlaD family protein n=1 Tax=uncultured Dysgonomonas sp. TaxID=206096 RepID=UPI00262C460A|nr:MlaD family protein [uncultured Dysgonomonas sp.]